MANRNNNRRPSAQPQTGEMTVEQVRPTSIDNGEDNRGAVTSRENQTRTQPEPDSNVTAIGSDPETLTKLARVNPFKGLGNRKSLMADVDKEITELVRDKSSHIQQASQLLAEAADLYGQGAEQEGKAREVANRACVLIYQDRANGNISNEELNGMLGDKFGFRGKGDRKDEKLPAGHPEAGKTPFGPGETIRKRVVRLVQAHEYTSGGDASRFFDGMDKGKVSQILNNVEQDKLPFWQAYEKLAELKREGSEGRINPAFDPKAVAKLMNALSTTEGVQAFANNRLLVKAYVELIRMVHVVDEQAAELLDQAA